MRDPKGIVVNYPASPTKVMGHMTQTTANRHPWLRWLRWLMLFGLATILGLAFAGQLYLTRQKIGAPVPWSFALGRSLADWYVFAVLSLPALWLGRQFPFSRGGIGTAVLVHLPAGAVFSLSWMALRAAVEQWLTRHDLAAVSFSDAFNRSLVATFVFNLLIYWGVLLAHHALSYYEKFHEREVTNAELEARLAQARLQALQMQLNPHFLFNTLHAISSLMHQDVEAADRMIAQLSGLLRYALESTEEQEVPLRQELEFLDRYLVIQQTRFRDRLEIRREIDPAALEGSVPNLALQPLVENAIQHGIAPYAHPGRITLRALRRDGHLVLEVEDNGKGLKTPAPEREGVGLANTRARLQQLYGAAHRFEFTRGAEGGLCVRLTIPWHKERGEVAPSETPPRIEPCP